MIFKGKIITRKKVCLTKLRQTFCKARGAGVLCQNFLTQHSRPFGILDDGKLVDNCYPPCTICVACSTCISCSVCIVKDAAVAIFPASIASTVSAVS